MKLGYARYCVDCDEVFSFEDSRDDTCPKCGSCSVFNLYNILNGDGRQKTYLQTLLDRRHYEQVYHSKAK